MINKKHKWWHSIINLWGTTAIISGNRATGQLLHEEICFCGKILNRKLEGKYVLHKIKQ